MAQPFANRAILASIPTLLTLSASHAIRKIFFSDLSDSETNCLDCTLESTPRPRRVVLPVLWQGKYSSLANSTSRPTASRASRASTFRYSANCRIYLPKLLGGQYSTLPASRQCTLVTGNSLTPPAQTLESYCSECGVGKYSFRGSSSCNTHACQDETVNVVRSVGAAINSVQFVLLRGDISSQVNAASLKISTTMIYRHTLLPRIVTASGYSLIFMKFLIDGGFFYPFYGEFGGRFFSESDQEYEIILHEQDVRMVSIQNITPCPAMNGEETLIKKLGQYCRIAMWRGVVRI